MDFDKWPEVSYSEDGENWKWVHHEWVGGFQVNASHSERTLADNGLDAGLTIGFAVDLTAPEDPYGREGEAYSSNLKHISITFGSEAMAELLEEFARHHPAALPILARAAGIAAEAHNEAINELAHKAHSAWWSVVHDEPSPQKDEAADLLEKVIDGLDDRVAGRRVWFPFVPRHDEVAPYPSALRTDEEFS